MSIEEKIQEMGRRGRGASRELALMSRGVKDVILREIAVELRGRVGEIVAANEEDLAEAREKLVGGAMLKRLVLDAGGVEELACAVEGVAGLLDPVGEVLEKFEGAKGIEIERVRVPIGVIGMIFESRPNVTVDAAVLCLKAGNAVILRGGAEALRTNLALAEALRVGGMRGGMPEFAVQLVPFVEREAVGYLAKMDRYLDLLIPRGGRGLIEAVMSVARVPVIKHYDGVCHLYVDEGAELGMAMDLAKNGKLDRPSACNALETILVHRAVAGEFLPRLVGEFRELGAECRGCEISCGLVDCVAASEEDWGMEYLDRVVSVKVVGSLGEAVEHIARYGSGHSDAIVTGDVVAAERFLREVDSACVYHNASTRFSDGGQFGFGAEIGISTDKLHARGPMGLRELTSYQYRIRGSGQVRGV